jgi:hypothetical protein
MRRVLVAVVALAIALLACSGSADPATGATGSGATPSAVADPATGPTGASSTGVVEASAPPEPDARIPLRAGALADRLETVWEVRREAVRRWVRTGDPAAWPPPQEVELLVLYEQRIYRVLAANDRLAAAVLGRLDGGLAAEARSNVRAGGALYDHFSPVKTLPDFRTRAPERRPAPGCFEKGDGGSGWRGRRSRP